MTLQLYMLLLGCKPKGRYTEQHDIFFSIGYSLKELIPDIREFWPGPQKIHIDAWRKVTAEDGHSIQIIEKEKFTATAEQKAGQLFFINLGGYKKEVFEEFHYKMLAVGKTKTDAIQKAKQTAFYQHTGFKGADSHIDDKYGVDVDDIYEIEDILPARLKEKYSLLILPAETAGKDDWHLGYTKLDKLTGQE